jgi:hypothetical protein
MRPITFWDLNPYRAQFAENVARGDSCWLWRGPRAAEFGQFRYTPAGERRSVSVTAHRVAPFFLGDGRIPTEAEDVRHRCANTLCVRPEHLVFEVYGRSGLELSPELLEPARERFLALVETGRDCWTWRGTIRNPSRDGFSCSFGIGGTAYIAARLALYFFRGRIILPTENVVHGCRNLRCMRPEHLEIVER